MNKILIIALLMAIGFTSNAQTFGGIRGKNNGGTQGDVKRDADALKVSDSTLKVRLDSMLVYQRADSLALSNIESYLTILYGNETGTNPFYYTDMIQNGQDKFSYSGVVTSGPSNIFTGNSLVTRTTIPVQAVGEGRLYKTMRILFRLTGTLSAPTNVILQGSKDSTSWLNVRMFDTDSMKLDAAQYDMSVTNVTKRWSVPIEYPYYRLYLSSSITGGAGAEAYLLLSQGSWSPSVIGVDSNQFRNTMKVSELPSIALGANSGVDIGDVTINNASGGSAVNIQDGGNSITVDGTVGVSGTVTVGSHAVTLDSTTQRASTKISELVPLVAGTAYIGKTRLTDGTTDAEVVPLAGYNAGAVAIVDGSGNHITSFGGGTQYAEGNTTDPATGTAALMRYDATDLALTDEQMSMPLLTDRGEQRILQKNGAVVSDVLTSNGDFVTIPCDGYPSILLDKLGTFNMTITPQWSVDGVTYTSNSQTYALTQTTATGTKAFSLTGTTQGQYILSTQGAKSVRLLVTSYTSGTCSITASATNYSSDVQVYQSSSSVPLQVSISNISASTAFWWAAEDATSVAGGTVSKTGLVRNDAPTSSASADLDYIDAKATKFGSMLVKDEERHFRTYTAAFTVAPAASCTDLFEIKAGSKTVKINKITITGTQTTGGTYNFYVIKRSTVNTGGTSSAATFVPHLTGDAAASSVGSIYTANPTLGTAVGSVGVKYLYVGTSTERADELVFDFGEKGKPIYLTGSTTQSLALNLNSRTFSGGSFAVTIEITEED